MCQGHYSPKLSRSNVTKLYQLGQKLKKPMTELADGFVEAGLSQAEQGRVPSVQERTPQYPKL